MAPTPEQLLLIARARRKRAEAEPPEGARPANAPFDAGRDNAQAITGMLKPGYSANYMQPSAPIDPLAPKINRTNAPNPITQAVRSSQQKAMGQWAADRRAEANALQDEIDRRKDAYRQKYGPDVKFAGPGFTADPNDRAEEALSVRAMISAANTVPGTVNAILEGSDAMFRHFSNSPKPQQADPVRVTFGDRGAGNGTGLPPPAVEPTRYLPQLNLSPATSVAEMGADMTGELGAYVLMPGKVIDLGFKAAGAAVRGLGPVGRAVTAITPQGAGVVDKSLRYGGRMVSTVPENAAHAFAFGAMAGEDGSRMETGAQFAADPLNYLAQPVASLIQRAGVALKTMGARVTPEAVQLQQAMQTLQRGNATPEQVRQAVATINKITPPRPAETAPLAGAADEAPGAQNAPAPVQGRSDAAIGAAKQQAETRAQLQAALDAANARGDREAAAQLESQLRDSTFIIDPQTGQRAGAATRAAQPQPIPTATQTAAGGPPIQPPPPIAQAANAAPPPGNLQPVTTPPVGQVSRDYAGLHPKVRAAVNRLLENSGVEPQRIPAIIANLDQLPPDKSEMVVTELIRKFGAGDPKLETNIEKVGRDFTVNTPTGKGDNAQAVVRGNIRRMLDEQGPLLEKAASDRFGPGAVATNEAIEAEVNQIRSVYRRILDPNKPYGNITSPAKRKEIDAAREDLKSYLKGPDVAASIPNWVRQDAINTLNRDLRAGGYQPIQKSGMTDFEWAEIVDAYPTQIAHSLQSSFATAGREASKSTDMQGKALARDLSEKRVGLLYLLEKSVDKYRDTRVKFGHEMGARDALTLPERFLSIADDEVKLGQLLDDLDELTPAQFDAAKSQITTVVRNAMGKKIENASLAEVGAGDRGVSTPNLTQLSKRGVLEALEKAFGADGKKLADDIRLSRAKTNMLTKIEPDFGARSASNIQDAANAPRLYEDPTATGANVIDQAGATLGGLGLGLGAMGNIPAAAGVLSLAGARAIWQAIKNGRKLSPEQRTQFAQFLFALRRGEAEAPRLEGPDAPPPSGPPPITGPKGPPKISSPAASRPPEKMGFGGSKQPIPMDEGARMGRAREQGDARVSPMDDEVAAILDSRPDAPDAELAKLWDDKIRAGTINPKDVPALVTRYRERHARNSVDFFIQNIIDKDRAAHQNPSELLGRISERLRQLGEMEPDKFLKREIEQRRRAIINGQNPLDPSQSGSSKLLAGMGASPEAVGGIGGAAAGYFGNPTDANQDGVIDDKDRGLNAMGGLMSGVVGGNIAKRGVNAMRNITPPKGPPTGPVQATFGGRRGAGTLAAKGEKRPQQALDMAEQMAAKGASRDEIWDATSKQLEGSPFAGAFKGKDGQWRFEIDDSGAEVIRPARRAVVDFTRLSDRMTDADAGGAYPPLADMTADFRHAKQEIGSAHEELGFRRDPDNPRWMIAVGGKDAAAQRSIALHERQHIIQQNEGFTTGASPDDFIPKDKQGKFAPFTQVGAYRNYRKTAGEVEARNVQKRADMTPAERRATPPWKTQDTPDKDQIARFGSGKQESRPPVSNGLAGKGPPRQPQANALKAGPPPKTEAPSKGGADRGPIVKNGLFPSKQPLPMDEASRMGRAREQGFDVDTPLYHGTTADIDAFNFDDIANMDLDSGAGVFLTRSPSEAGFFAQKQTDTMGSRSGEFADDANTMPVYARIRKPAIFETQREFRAAVQDAPYNRKGQGAALRQELEKQGYDGVIIRNSEMDGQDGAEWRIIFDPSNIRGKFATFDPAQSGSSKLLAGVSGLGGVGLISAAATMPKDEKKKPPR